MVKNLRSSMASRGSTKHTLKQVKFDRIDHTKSGRVDFKVTPYRWIILALFCGLIFNLVCTTVGFASFVKQIKVAYQVESWAVLILIVIPTALYAIMNFAGASLFSHMKIHSVLKMAASF